MSELLRDKRSPASLKPFSIALLDDERSWNDLRIEWNRLNVETGQPSLFRTWEWSRKWWEVFLAADPTRLRVITVRDAASELIGIFPFHCTERARGRASGREWRLLGDLGGHHEDLTEEPPTLITAGYETEVVEAVTRFLSRNGTHQWDFYRFEVQAERPPFTGKRFQVETSGCLAYGEWQTLPGSSLVSLPPTWDAFRKTLSRSMRDNLPYYPRRLAKAGHTHHLRFLTEPEEVCGATPLVIELHRHRAENETVGKRHCSHITEEKHEQFLLEYLPVLAERREAFIVILEIDDRPVAAQIFLRFDTVLTFYYSGFRTAWHAYSPLFIVAVEVLKRAIEWGIQTVNFLPNDEPWKSRWGATVRGGLYRRRATRLAPDSLYRFTRALFHVK